MKKLFLLLLIVTLGFSGCKTLGNQNDSLQRLVEQGKQNLSVQKPSNNTQNPPQTNVPEVSVVSPENKDTLPKTKTFIDTYGDMYVITVEKFEKNIQSSSGYIKPKTGAEFVGALVHAENKGKHFKTFSSFSFTLKDSTSYTYSPTMIGDEKKKEFFKELAPGESVEGWAFFEVPKTVVVTKLTLIFSTGEYTEDYVEKTIDFILQP
jgi:hypothetical protein